MPALFAFTDRQLALEEVRRQALLLAIPILLAIGWIAWLLLARINVYATTDQARVEVAEAVYFVQAPVSGRVMESHLELGREVEPGSALVELAADPQKVRVEGEQKQQVLLQAQLENLRHELAEEQNALATEGTVGRLVVDQARANLAAAEETLQLAQKEWKQKTELQKQGIISALDLARSESELKRKQIELQSYRTAVSRAQREQAIRGQERKARIEEISGQIRRIEGELAASDNAVKGLQNELGWHRIVASARGRLDQVVNIKPGSYVQQGDHLAVIIPSGQLRIVAYFEPRAVIGRVKIGQTGRLRLEGFPWAEYGSVTASVTSVGSEVRDGRVRVELDARPNPRLALQHGLPGALEIQIEQTSPASFLFRKTGLFLAQPTASQVASQ
jgi:multidrug resistance efflux pump